MGHLESLVIWSFLTDSTNFSVLQGLLCETYNEHNRKTGISMIWVNWSYNNYSPRFDKSRNNCQSIARSMSFSCKNSFFEILSKEFNFEQKCLIEFMRHFRKASTGQRGIEEGLVWQSALLQERKYVDNFLPLSS